MVALHVDNKKVSVLFLFKMKRAFTCSIYTSLKTKILTTMKLIDSTCFGMFNLQFTICLQVMTQPKNLFNLDLNFIEIHFVFVFVFGFFFVYLWNIAFYIKHERYVKHSIIEHHSETKENDATKLSHREFVWYCAL